ncbi:unnamed protein product, partial [Laminaria digitata]
SNISRASPISRTRRFVPTVVIRGSHPIRAVGFSPDGGLFAAGSNDRALRVSRTPTEAELSCSDQGSQDVLLRDNLHRGSIYCLAFSPDSSIIATGKQR